jgi:glutamate racemase
MTIDRTSSPIGVFDSGVGGISVLRAIRKELPGEATIYFADQAHVPYGERPLEEVRKLSEAISLFLISEGVKLIVVACNTASAAALHYLRDKFPEMPFVGMEPAVKPAAENSKSGVVGVLATPATFQGTLYGTLIERFANDLTVLRHTCPGLVNQIEAGDLDSPETRAILEAALQPMINQGIDTVVLGCTHYPFVIPVIEEITGPHIQVIDPSPAVARQTHRILEQHNLLRPVRSSQGGGYSHELPIRLITSKDKHNFSRLVDSLLREEGIIEGAFWRRGKLTKSG